MFNGQTINFIYLLGILYAIYSITSSINKKKRLGDMVLDIDNVKTSTRIVIVIILTILVLYMMYLSFNGYSAQTSQDASKNTGILINLVLEVLFWLSIYFTFLYAQFGKRYVGKNGLSTGTKAYVWNEIKQYSFKENQLAITAEEKFFSRTRERGVVLDIPMEKVKETTDILRVRVRR